MIQKAIDAIALAFHTEPKFVGFVTESDSMVRYLDYFVKSELERHSNNDFQLIKKVQDGYTLYNGTQIRILKGENAARGMTFDTLFCYDVSDKTWSCVYPTMICGRDRKIFRD